MAKKRRLAIIARSVHRLVTQSMTYGTTVPIEIQKLMKKKAMRKQARQLTKR